MKFLQYACVLLVSLTNFCQAQSDQLYVLINWQVNDLATFDVTDASSAINGSTSPASRLTALAINHNGELFAASRPISGPGTLYQLDAKTAQVVGSVPLNLSDVAGMAFSPDSTLYGVNVEFIDKELTTALYILDPESGQEQLIGDTGLRCLSALEFGNDGKLYSWHSDNACTSNNGLGLIRLNIETGIPEDINPTLDSFELNPLGMGLAGDGNLYICNDDTGDIFRVEISDGSVTLAGSVDTNLPHGLAGVAPILLGDVNCDNAVDLLDVEPFVDSLSSKIFVDKADINRDGAVNLLDVNPFIAVLSGQ